MRVSKSIIGLLAILMTACQIHDDQFVDFANIEAAKGMSFKVIAQHETNLENGLPSNCYLPGGMRVNEYCEEGSANPQIKKASSVTGAAILQQLYKFGNQNRVTEIVGTYPSINVDWDTITLSGKVMLPTGKRPKRLILVSHYTVCSNAEAPSNCFSFEGILVKMGYGLIIPDYLGYGVTAKEVHPYLVMDLTARNVLDMYLAVRPWLKAVDMEPENPEIMLMGYSQGGANTMAVEHLIETEYWSDDDPQQIKIHRVFAGGGPYDVKATYEGFVNTDTASYPVAVPMVVQGMILGNKLDIQMTDLMQPWLYEHLDEWVNSKRYTSGQINGLIGTKVTHEMLTEEAMDQTSWKVSELQKAMVQNSITSFNWVPQASVYIAHSMDDETVPFANAAHAKSKWNDSNITYNFGHYGGHVMTCLRFIYSVQSLLQQEEEERRKYE